jgi:hypothetical protein
MVEERRLLKPKPSEERLAKYWSNWWRRGHRQPIKKWRGKCFICKEMHVLCDTIYYRGESRPANLICDSCFKNND